VRRHRADLYHLIGLGILLSAALMIAIGSFGAPSRSADASAQASVAGIEAQGQRR
jgi:hypothetical protein